MQTAPCSKQQLLVWIEHPSNIEPLFFSRAHGMSVVNFFVPVLVVLAFGLFIHNRTNSAILRRRFANPPSDACSSALPDAKLLTAISSDSPGLVLVLGADEATVKATIWHAVCQGHPTAYIEASEHQANLDAWLTSELGLRYDSASWYGSVWSDWLPADMPQVKLVIGHGDRLFAHRDIEPWLLSMAEKSCDHFHHPFKVLLLLNDEERYRQVCMWNGGTKIRGLNLL